MHRALTTSSFLSLAAVSLLAGCPDRTISEVNPQQGRVEFKDIPVNPQRDIDILFVIDDSGSMADKQSNLVANFPNFINVLNTIEGGLPDVHIGVVSSDMGTKPQGNMPPGAQIGAVGQGGCAGTGDDGVLQTNGAPITGNYLSDIRDTMGGRIRNYTGDLATVFSQMAVVGRTGCGFEQHLHSMRRALENVGANQGFLRENAFLAVIFIADEDDCSVATTDVISSPASAALGEQQSFRCTRFGVTCEVGGQTPEQMAQLGPKSQCRPNDTTPYMAKVQEYVDFLKGLKEDPSKVIVAGVMGNVEPVVVETQVFGGVSQPTLGVSCSYQGASGTEVAVPSVRIKAFLDAFPNRNTFTTICQQDLSGGLQQIAQLLKTALGSPCIDGKLADVDPNTDGMQYDCSVSDVTNYLKPNQVETIVPPCNGDESNKPCWKIDTDPVKCPAPSSGNILNVVRDVEPPPDAHMLAYCVTEAE